MKNQVLVPNGSRGKQVVIWIMWSDPCWFNSMPVALKMGVVIF